MGPVAPSGAPAAPGPAPSVGGPRLQAAADFAVVASFLRLFAPAAQLEPPPSTALALALHDSQDNFLKDLYFKLLRRAVKNFRPNEWEKSLIKFCHQRGFRQDAWELERFGYKKSNVQVKLRVLKYLLEYQFVCNTKFKTIVNKMENRELRLNPLGRDEKGRCYWIQRDHRANMRLYREDQDEETWELIASDRAGLVEVIAALKSGKSPTDSATEPVLNEDSNSVGSSYVPNASSGSDMKNDSSPPPAEDKNGDETDGVASDNAEDKSNKKSVGNSESADNSEFKNADEAQSGKSDRSEDASECVGEEKVEDLMIIEGVGDGADCESAPTRHFSEEIEEDVMYFYGEGSGRDCEAGNPGQSTNPDSDVAESVDGELVQDLTAQSNYFSEEIEEEVMYFYGEGSGYDCATGNPDAVSTSVDKSAEDETVEDLAARNNNRSGDDEASENDDEPDPKANCENDADKNSIERDETDLDSKEEDVRSAPLPVTKRFLQNIPKSAEKSECDASPNKAKLWSVDSLCGSSDSPSKSPEVRANVNSANETVLVNKNSFLDNNKSSVTDSSTNSTLENNCKSDNRGADLKKVEVLSDIKSDCEISNNSETQNNLKECNDVAPKCENDETLSNATESAEIRSEMKMKNSQTDGDPEKTLSVLKDNIKSETEIEINNKRSDTDSENISNLVDANVKVENLTKPDDSVIKDSIEDVKVVKPENASLENSKNLNVDDNLPDNLSIKSSNKHKVDPEIDLIDQNLDSKFLPKKIKLGEDNFDAKKVNLKSIDDSNIAEIESSVVIGNVQVIKSTKLSEESHAAIPNEDAVKSEVTNADVSIKKMNAVKVTPAPINSSLINFDEDMNDDLDDEFCQSIEDDNGIAKESDDKEAAANEISPKTDELETKITDKTSQIEEVKDAVKDVPVKDSPVKDKLVKDTPLKNTPVKDSPVKDTPVKDVEVKDTPNVKRTRRSENLKDTKLSDLIKKADTELFSNVHKPGKKSGTPKKEDDSKESKKDDKGRKRGREDSASQSEEEVLETQKNKKVKTKQKILSKKLRKKADSKEAQQDSSSEEDAETSPSKGSSKKTSPSAKKSITESHSGKFKKRNSKKKGSKSKSKENAAVVDDDPPVRQSRRIAQLKIKEEAQRRLMEEKALRELKEKHKKNTGKEKVDKDWEQNPSDVNSSDEEKNVKPSKKVSKSDQWQKKMLGWNSSSGGNETDSEPGEPEDDFDEQEEEDILAHKSDHEFSPESDVEQEDTVPVRRARTLKKEDDEAPEDPDAACVHCGKADHPEWILLCDSCDAGWHASCLKPVLFLVPEGEWFCPPCNHKKLINALEEQLDEFDEHVKQVEIEDSKRKKSNQSADKVKESRSDEEEEVSDEEESSDSNSEDSGSTSSSSDDEKIYRLRERRQLPISYRFKEYDQLICSAIKEEYKEDDNSGAGNQGRGKDISTIIEADKEEKKLQQASQGDEEVDEEEVKRRKLAARNRRRPAKLTSLDVQSDFSDNSDEDFKEAGWSTPSSEAISSESGQSSSSHSSDSMPLRRSLRPSKPSKRKSLADAARSKKKKRKRSSEDDTSEDSIRRKKSKRKSRDSNKRSKKKRKEKSDTDNDGGTKTKSKVKYGGLSDDSKSSHDWSPAHRTRQRKYNYMEEPNTESEDEVHKPSGKHMDSSDEYKEESESGSDSDSSRVKGKSRFFDDDILNLQASKEAYQKQLESSGSDLLKGSLVPVIELANISPVKNDGVPTIDRVLNVENSTPIVSSNKSTNRAKRGRGFTGTPRKSIKIYQNTFIQNAPLPNEEREQRIAMLKAKGLIKDGDPINDSDLGIVTNIESKLGEPLRIPIKPAVMTQFQIEREKKRKEKEEKNVEKEKKKEERLKKKEELQLLKEQRAKEREEKKVARLASKDKVRKARPPEFMGTHGQSMSWSIPIQRPPGNFSQGMPQRAPMIHPGMNIRGPIPMNPNQIRMRMEHPNIPIHVQQLCKDGTMSPENRDPMFNYRRHPMESLGSQMRQGESSGSEELSGQGMPYDDRKDMSIPIDHRLQPYDHMPPDGRKHFPPGARLPFPGPHRGMPPNMDGHNIGNRPPGPGYGDNMGSPMIRGDVHIRPILNNANDNHNDFIPRNGIPISDLREHPGMARRPPSAHLDDSSSDNSGQGPSTVKRRGRGPGKKTLARQAAANSSNDGNSPSNSPMSEGMLTVAGAPQPFRPNVDPPSIITRMPHMMPPPFRGSNMYNSSGPMYGQPRPSNHLAMGGGYRPHHTLTSHHDPSPSGGGPIAMTSPERNSPQNQYPPYPPAPYYPPPSTPPQLGSYPPPPHGRFPPQIPGPRSRSPTPHNPSEASETDDKSASSNPSINIKQEPGITIKQSLSPTEELEESASLEAQPEAADDTPSNLSTTAPAPPPRPAHRQLKHTESKNERAGRGRISLTTAARYPQGPYAPQYGPYAPQPQPPQSDVSYLHHPIHPNIHQASPQQQPPIHRPMYPHPHPPAHIPPIQIPPRPTLTPIQSTEPQSENAVSSAPIPPQAPAREDEPSEFGGLVSYFSSQQEDDIDT